MTATDELRRMLDERGVEYDAIHSWLTCWGNSVCGVYDNEVYECSDGTFVVSTRRLYDTTAQVIEVTLGRDWCHDKNGGCSDEYTHGFECTVCEATTDSYMRIPTSNKDEPFDFCPCCGRQVKR